MFDEAQDQEFAHAADGFVNSTAQHNRRITCICETGQPEFPDTPPICFRGPSCSSPPSLTLLTLAVDAVRYEDHEAPQNCGTARRGWTGARKRSLPTPVPHEHPL